MDVCVDGAAVADGLIVVYVLLGSALFCAATFTHYQFICMFVL